MTEKEMLEDIYSSMQSGSQKAALVVEEFSGDNPRNYTTEAALSAMFLLTILDLKKRIESLEEDNEKRVSDSL